MTNRSWILLAWVNNFLLGVHCPEHSVRVEITEINQKSFFQKFRKIKAFRMLVSRNIFLVRLFSFSTLCRVQTNSMHFAPLVLDFFFLAWNPISFHLSKQLTIARDKQTNSTSRPMTIFTKTFSSLDTKCQLLSFSQCRKTKNSHFATSASSFAFSSPNPSPLLLQIWQLFVKSIWST